MFKDKIILNSKNLLEIYGEANEKIDLVKSYFPDLKITARGVELMLEGEENRVKKLKKIFLDIIDYSRQNKSLNKHDIEQFMQDDSKDNFLDCDFKLIGRNGNLIKPKTMNQKK